MATFFVDDTGIVTTASTAADSIFLQSAAAKASTINGGAGNDTINLLEGAATNASALGIIVDGQAGADSVTISSLGAFSAGNHSILGGAGADTILVTGSTIGLIKTQDDADRVVFSGGTLVAAKLGGGNDEIVFSDGTLTELGLGKGNDKVSASTVALGTAASITGGAGKDTITLTVSNLSAALFQGDGVNGVDADADKITLNGVQSSTTVKGGGGADILTFSGDGGSALLFRGNAGNDSIVISGFEGGTSIGGGSGNDTIQLTEASIANSAHTFGGSGNDSIHLLLGDHNDGSKNFIDGGAGADSITFSAAASLDTSGAKLGVFQVSAFSESNLTTLDVIDLNGTETTGTMTMDFDYGVDLSAAVVTEASAIGILGSTTFSGNIAAGVATFSGTSNVSSVTAMAGTVDSLTLNDGANEVVLFETKGGKNYLFVQGGTAGTADDSVISLSNISGGTIVATNNTAVVTFSGIV